MTIERIAAELRDGEVQGYLPGRIALHAHLADVVALRRIPPLPEDGPRTRERFLEMWKEADADLEPLRAAKAERARIADARPTATGGASQDR